MAGSTGSLSGSKLEAFHTPKVGDGRDRRELCDVLGVARELEVSNESTFVVQNNVAPAGLKRKTWRQGKSIQNQIMEGIGQLKGAINALRRGERIYRNQAGTSIANNPPECVGEVTALNLDARAARISQSIMVTSGMHHVMDWEAVLFELGRVFLSTRDYGASDLAVSGAARMGKEDA